MNPNEPGLSDELRHKFPQLQLIKRKPVLRTINGFGLSVYGQRDWDPETRTYVKTHCLCALFIPVLALGAYRVVEASPRSWYFLGKEPLSGFARSWNLAVGVVSVFLAVAIGWNAHTSSPEYRARQEIQHAAALMQAGEPLKAAGIYRQQLNGPAATDARTGLQSAVEASLKSDKSQTVAAAFHLLAGLPANANQPAPLVPDAFNRGLTLVEKFRAASPESALGILSAAANLDPTNPAVLPLQIDLLKQILAANPDDINHVVELAVVYENAGQLDESWKLLRPYQHKLGATEGARILGQKLLQEQNYADAYDLLFPYVQTRLDKLHGIEGSYSNTVASINKQALDDLNAGRADRSFYTAYKAAAKDRQDEMVDNYIQTRMQTDPAYQRVLTELKEANQIVPVTLDLGIVQLNRAQELKDAAARKTELEAAEKTFLAIRGFAGETDEYRMFLGQVYYWLGKSKEGRELFDQLLASRKRDYTILMSLSETLRDVGESADARALVEEAYRTAKSDKGKYAAAALRALLCRDDDDRMAWLQKSDPSASWVLVELNEARGRKALQQGNKSLAADFFGKAVNGYQAEPKTSASLNNWALACFDLYEATGNVEDQKHGMALLEEAVAMDPGNSILLHNTTYFLISRAVMNVNHDSINVAALGDQPGLHMLSLLYQDEPGRTQIYQQLREDEAMKKGLGYLDKALLLAPKEPELYSTALAIYGGFRNLNELQKLQQRFKVAAPDLTEIRQGTLDSYSAAKDKENLERLQQRIRSLKALVQTPAVNGDPLTLEYVNVTLNTLQQNAWIYGGNVDGQELLRTALATSQNHPSSASRAALESAYFFLANQELAQQNPEYAALVNRTRRALGSEYIIICLLERGGPLADLLRKNDNVTAAIALEKEILKSFPSWAGINEWAMLRTTDPETAAVVAKRIKENETTRLINDLEFQLSPCSASSVLDEYWIQRLLGDEKRATEIYQQAVHDGVPLPPL